jgi:hypothetical protein
MKHATNLRKLHHKLATWSGVTILCNWDFQWGSWNWYRLEWRNPEHYLCSRQLNCDCCLPSHNSWVWWRGLERIIRDSISEWHSLWRPCAKGWRDGFSPCLCTFWARVIPIPWRWGSVINSSSVEKEIQSIEVDEALSGGHLSLCAYGQYQVVILCR